MSFDLGPIGNLSNVQKSSKTTDGGGGNTGYFKRGQKEEETNLEFPKDYGNDSFEKEIIDEVIEEDSLLDIIKNLISDFLNFIKKIFKK